MLDSLVVVGLILAHIDPLHALEHDHVELLSVDVVGQAVRIVIIVILFLLLQLLNLLVDDLAVDVGVGVQLDDVCLAFVLLLLRDDDSVALATLLNEGEDLFRLKVILEADGLDVLLLLLERFVALDPLVVGGQPVVADVKEVLLLLKAVLKIKVLVTELDHIGLGFFDIVKRDRQTDDLKLLLLDAGLVEQALLVELVELLFEGVLDLVDLVAHALEADLPLLLLLLAGVFEALLKVLESLLLVVVHVIGVLVHPLLTNELFFELVLLFLEEKLVASQHGLEAALAEVITLHKGLFLQALALSLLHLSALLSIVESLDLDIFGLVDLKDVIRVLSIDLDELFEIDLSAEVLK